MTIKGKQAKLLVKVTEICMSELTIKEVKAYKKLTETTNNGEFVLSDKLTEKENKWVNKHNNCLTGIIIAILDYRIKLDRAQAKLAKGN